MEEVDQALLDSLAEEFSAAMRRGESPSIEQYVSRYPDAGDALRSLLGSIQMIEGLKTDAPSDKLRWREIQQLDDYTIIREIGRGGMGVVLEAIHQSLGRRVAVKVFASGLLGDPKHLARFKREARAAARLRHSNIVPVFGVGSADGHHYYVMDYIDGLSLREWLESVTRLPARELPTLAGGAAETDVGFAVGDEPSDDIRTGAPSTIEGPPPDRDSAAYCLWAAEMTATICNALQYAHSQGVLHRDIKPANLLLDRHGEIWIADFGLAKLTEQQAVTMTGEVVGTPQYMPPESFDGNYDIKSEVYAVALTLWELLTQSPAIEGRSTADVIRRASAGVSESPRKRNPHVPRDLETIVMKALSIDVEARYGTAGELRDDLRRLLADRPISARRTGPLERVLRWSRREPVVASLTGATFTLLLALATVSAAAFFRTRQALRSAENSQRAAETSLQQRTDALTLAESQRLRAEKNLEVALNAFDEVMQNISDRGVEPDAEFLGEVTDTTSPDVTPDDARLLQSLLGFFDELADNNSDDLLQPSALAARRAGDIYMRLGDLSGADRAYSDSLTRYQRILENDPNNLSTILAQAETMNELAVVTGLRGRFGRANELFERTITTLSASDEAARSPEGRFEYARAHRLFASLAARVGLDGLAPAPAAPRRLPRRALGAMMRVRTQDELDAIDESIRTLETLVDEGPLELRYQAELARAYRDKAKLASRAKRKAESEQSIRESIDLFESLLTEHRESDAIRFELATTLASTEAYGFHQIRRAVRADQLSTYLLGKAPEVPRYKALKAHTLKNLAAHQQRTGNTETAEKNLGQSIQLFTGLIADAPDASVYEARLAQAMEQMADLKLTVGDTEAAISYLERAIRRLQPRLTRRPELSPVSRMQSQRMKQKLGRIRNAS